MAPSTYEVLATLLRTPALWLPLQQNELLRFEGLEAFVQDQITRIKQKVPDLATFDELSIAQGLRSLTPSFKPSATDADQSQDGKKWTTKTETDTWANKMPSMITAKLGPFKDVQYVVQLPNA